MEPGDTIDREGVLAALSTLPNASDELAHRHMIIFRNGAGDRIELMAYRVHVVREGKASWAWLCEVNDEKLFWPTLP